MPMTMISGRGCGYKDMKVTLRGRVESEAAREQFVRELWQALGHLYEPDLTPGAMLQAVLGTSERDAVRRLLVRGIEGCAPSEDVPETTSVHRLYTMLTWRYIDAVTQEEVAERLSLSVRHVRREQRKAIRMLADHLLAGGEGAPEADAGAATTTSDWREQVRAELAALSGGGSEGISDLDDVLEGLRPVAELATRQKGVRLTMRATTDDLSVAMHPTALRQVVVGAIGRMVESMSGGELRIVVARGEGKAVIGLCPAPPIAQPEPGNQLVGEILSASGGRADWVGHGSEQRLAIALPLVPAVQVLVVDDNSDLMHVYRRYAQHTPYRLIHAATGQQALQRMDAPGIDIIVLDVMLPDTDGWELLTRLRQLSGARRIPVVVSSVVREQSLAEALGADGYLVKPVRREAFLAALERVAPRARASGE